MSNEYSGSNANPLEVLDLANAYFLASKCLFSEGQKQVALSMAPARMCAIHAIELYLNAFLRHEGVAPEEIRKRMHNLVDSRFVAKLQLRKKTALHLQAMTAKREYFISRYAPEQAREHSELTRLAATLLEVMEKVGKHLHSTSSGGTSTIIITDCHRNVVPLRLGCRCGEKEGAPKRPDIVRDKLPVERPAHSPL
ncbi:hypothetical protein [Rhizobium etli]|nr:hypothetical protein [Rhizobium etli]